MKPRRIVSINTISVVAVIFCIAAVAQEQQGQGPRGRWLDQPHAAGTITAIRSDAIDLQTREGNTATVKITSDTQFHKDRAPAKFSDFKVGDMIMAVGEQQQDGTLAARFVAGGMPRREGGRMGVLVGGSVSREDLGKKFIAGEVKKIEETKLTVLRPDKVEQVIEVDENTSFRNDKNESITLADIKLGDHVAGPGEFKNDIFVATTLRAGSMRPHPEHDPRQAPDQK